jgi:peptidyl-prolyl isomerase E (cyclophilin E)
VEFRFVEFELPEDAAASVDNMHESELYGRTIKVSFARPPRTNERSQRPVWADDEWLKQYGQGSGFGTKNAENGAASSGEEEEGTEGASESKGEGGGATFDSHSIHRSKYH